MKFTLFASAISLLCASPAFAQTNQDQNQQNSQNVQQQKTQLEAQVRTTFINSKGENIGTATLHEAPNGVLIIVEANGLPPGMHGFHIHEVGACDAQDGFESAGSHYAPQDAAHGYEMQGGPHAGDLPNQYVSQDGVLKAEIFSHMTTISESEAPLLDADGSALVIHSGADDYRSQPSGNAGSRIACAPITKEQQQAMRSGVPQKAQP